MLENGLQTHLVAVIGAGPAGLFSAQYLARQGVQVVLFNRDIKPGGLAEYGIFPDKYKMRQGLQAKFRRILSMPNVHYQGNVVIGQSGDFRLDQLRQAGFQAFMVTTGASECNWLGLPGEDLDGVYQANEIVFYYNRLPEKAQLHPRFGRRILIIGVGNVMLDIVHYLEKEGVSCTVTAVGRRGPAEVKFDKPTLVQVAGCLDMDDIRKEVTAAFPAVRSVGEDVDDFYSFLEKTREKASTCSSEIRIRLRFLRSPRRLVRDEGGQVKEVVLEKNHLKLEDGKVTSYRTGVMETLPADTVIFSIGSRVDEDFGLPVIGGHFATTPTPSFPVEGISYEVYNPDLNVKCEDIFVSGWARLASEGVVGLARKDGERGAKALLNYLDSCPPVDERGVSCALAQLTAVDKKIINLADLEKLRQMEQKIAAEEGLPEFKFNSKDAMLRVIEGN